jgi:hypothetical protein
MTKVVKNSCYGGFSLSPEAEIEYLRRKRGEAHAYEKAGDPRGKFAAISLAEYEWGTQQYLTHVDNGWYTDELEGHFSGRQLERDDPLLIEVIEDLGADNASGEHADLTIVEIPGGVDWEIDDYDGAETIRETHRTW